MYVVYVIYNKQCEKIYIGQTLDINTRLAQHNKHTFSGYTSRFSGEWILIHSEQYSTRQEALIREKQLKSFRGRESIKEKYIPR
jgi:putative endonuclease